MECDRTDSSINRIGPDTTYSSTTRSNNWPGIRTSTVTATASAGTRSTASTSVSSCKSTGSVSAAAADTGFAARFQSVAAPGTCSRTVPANETSSYGFDSPVAADCSRTWYHDATTACIATKCSTAGADAASTASTDATDAAGTISVPAGAGSASSTSTRL